jgi:hypothetical protein
MAITINGTGTITGISAGGLPDGIVDTDMLATDAVTAAKIGSLPAGSVLQVQSAVKTDAATVTATSTPALISGLTVNITPASTSNKILIICTLSTTGSGTYAGRHLILRRDSTSICIGDADGNRNRASVAHQEYLGHHPNNFGPDNCGITFLDTPATTSQITYGVAYADTSGDSTIYINRPAATTNSTEYNRGASSIIVMEVAG